jgi:acetyl esterase/lipase
VEFNIRYYDEKIVWKRALDIAIPKDKPHKTAIFYIHGGGWSAGAREHFHYHLEYFSGMGYLCASAGYRLVPSVGLMEQLSDVISGYDRFVSYIREKKYSIDRIIVVGSSAGALLGSLLCLTDPDHFNGGIDLTTEWMKPVACVSINGPGTLEKWPDMDEEAKKLIEDALGASYDDYDADLFKSVSPISHVGGDSPDFLFIIVGLEKVFPHEYIYKMAEKLKSYKKRAEVILFPEARHGFFYELKTEEQKQALNRLEQFISSYNHGKDEDI